MAGKSLTDFAIRKAKPGAGVVKLSDGGGLQLYALRRKVAGVVLECGWTPPPG